MNGVGARNGSPDWTELPLNGMYGAIAGKSHRKQTATTTTNRSSDRSSLTGHGPGSRRHRAPYISAHRPSGNGHIRGGKSGGPGDASHELGEHDIPLGRTEPRIAGGHRQPGLGRFVTRVLGHGGDHLHLVRSEEHT